MKQNVSIFDRWVRWILAVVLIILAATGTLSGTGMWIALVVALIFIVTGFMQSCPIYMMLGLSTLKKKLN